MNLKTFLLFIPLISITMVHAGEISAVPGPDDQGGMIMPMVTIQATSGPATNPTAGIVNVAFTTTNVFLHSLNYWSPGDWFAAGANWKNDISPVAGSVSGMPLANAGAGDLFNNQFGFMFMSMGSMMMANVPTGNSLGIRLTSISSLDLDSFNYGNAANRWDQVFDGVGSQVLWNGSMWHNYFTMPDITAAGTYSAVFEIFVATTPFTGTTGFAQYDAAALSAVNNLNFTPTTVTYQFTVVPEPSTYALLLLTGVCFLVVLHRKMRVKAL